MAKAITNSQPSKHAVILQKTGTDWAYPLGFWSAVVMTAGGILYFLVLLAAMLAGDFTFPPPESLQLFGGVTSLLFCPVLVVLMACIHTTAPQVKKGFSQAALAFTILFAAAVSTNRFTQLGAVRQGMAAGQTEGISWFLAYGDISVMFGMEMMGWAWFLGLAFLTAAPLFKGWLRGCMLLYAVLALFSAAAYLLASSLSVIGFAAWGVVLIFITALLAVHFRQGMTRL